MHQRPRLMLPPAKLTKDARHTLSQIKAIGDPVADVAVMEADSTSYDVKNLGIDESVGGETPAKESKLDQIVQNFFTKAALVILRSRCEFPPSYTRGLRNRRINKWFNIEIEETDVLRQDLWTWKSSDTSERRPPQMIIETFLDVKHLSHKQSLVIVDAHGKKHDVSDSLTRNGARPDEILLERWNLGLGQPSTSHLQSDQTANLATVYKKGIVLFRSLYSYSKFVPVHRLSKHLNKTQPTKGLKIGYRILLSPVTDFTELDTPFRTLDGSPTKASETFTFGTIETPAGPLSIQVDYRTNCDFDVDDSETLLSSRFMGADDEFFKPSLPESERTYNYHARSRPEPGSLPAERSRTERPDRGQAYGSMSTFHQIGPATGSSPISALRAARDAGSQSPSSSSPRTNRTSVRSGHDSFASLRSVESIPAQFRRQSMSFQPFKVPPLSGSPSLAEHYSGSSPRLPSGRMLQPSALAESRAIPSSANPATVARRPVSAHIPPEHAIASSESSSPKPASITRYSSSFSHRRPRMTSVGIVKTEEVPSSARTTPFTAVVPVSAVPASTSLVSDTGPTRTGSLHEDDENITDFLKMLDRKRDLLIGPEVAGIDEPARRTLVALSRFQRMRDSNVVLTDSLTSSVALQRSSSTSSRQLSSAQAMVPGTSLTVASSPGKPMSPHTPHTPAVPSRLSANSIIDYSQHDRNPNRRHRLSIMEHGSRSEEAETEDTGVLPGSTHVNAIDIPTSPRPFDPIYRRSSSVAQRNRASAADDDAGDIYPFGLRSASLGNEDRPSLSLGALISQHGETADQPHRDDGPRVLAGQISAAHEERSSSLENRLFGPQLPHGSGTNDSGSASSSNQQLQHRSVRGGRGRFSFSRPSNNFEEDEPLLFAMSDFGVSRRSIDEGRGPPSTGVGERERDRSGLVTNSDASLRRGSRRTSESMGGYHAWS